MAKLIFQIISRITLILYPIRISGFLKNIRNHIYSYRTASMFNKVSKIYINGRIILHNGNKISIGNNAYLSNGVTLAVHKTDEYNPKIKIGSNCYLGADTHITCINRIEIGDNFLSGRRVTITDNSHGWFNLEDINIAPIKRKLVSKGPVSIGSNVWIGENVVILPGVRIGNNCIIGAGSIVTKNIDDNSLAVGNPARVIKHI